MLTTSAYQVFSDTHLTTATRIIKTLCGGFPLACRQWGKVVTANGGIQNVSIALPITVSTILTAVCSSYTSQRLNDSNSGQVSDFTNKSLTLTIDNGAGVWLAICK